MIQFIIKVHSNCISRWAYGSVSPLPVMVLQNRLSGTFRKKFLFLDRYSDQLWSTSGWVVVVLTTWLGTLWEGDDVIRRVVFAHSAPLAPTEMLLSSLAPPVVLPIILVCVQVSTKKPTKTWTYSQNRRFWFRTWQDASLLISGAFVVFTVGCKLGKDGRKKHREIQTTALEKVEKRQLRWKKISNRINFLLLFWLLH